MRHLKKICLNFVLILSLGFIAACGDDDANTVATDKFTIAYTAPMMGEKEGKTVFTITVTDTATGDPATGLALTLAPVMQMSSPHSAAIGDVTDNEDGTYTCTVYYLMMTMGDQGWKLAVTASDGFESTTTTFTPTVGMAMGTTAKATLKGQADMIAGMMGMADTQRTYYIFNDGLSGTTGSHVFNIFIAARENMMSHPAVYEGKTLTDENSASWNVDGMTVQVRVNEGSWENMNDDGLGYWSSNNLAGIVEESTIDIKLSVEGAVTEQKTTTGAEVVADVNDFARFTVSMSM